MLLNVAKDAYLNNYSKTIHYTQKCLSMDDIRNDDLFWFRDVTKQNGRVSVGTLYRDPLGEILVHYESGYKIEKGLR